MVIHSPFLLECNETHQASFKIISTPAPHFFVSYSREDTEIQRRIIAELRGRGIIIWVDIENLIPGSSAWEREIERSIRGAAGVIVLLSPVQGQDEFSCEIFRMDLYTGESRQLTNNDICDYQLRWGQ